MSILSAVDQLKTLASSLKMDVVPTVNTIKNDIKGLKIGVPKEYFGDGINSEVKQAVRNDIMEILYVRV